MPTVIKLQHCAAALATMITRYQPLVLPEVWEDKNDPACGDLYPQSSFDMTNSPMVRPFSSFIGGRCDGMDGFSYLCCKFRLKTHLIDFYN
ncbi:hypothetical protein EYC80_003180 [Monilinia laxa]|uniref:Uncharacterized protein n=1 Tax=Monilinia laxa TaxID=61186 RepID=A0A5N6KD14_MONLA|nr:hypothetical protein EYC80_003180 [Monilinia laxa]